MQDITNDEVDLIEIIEIIWDGKWLIGALTVISLTLLSAGALIWPPSFEGRIDIAALNKTQMAAYAPINDTPGISPPIYEGRHLVGYQGVIISNDLFKGFTARIRQGASIAAAHNKLDPYFINFSGSASQKSEELTNLSLDYQLSIDKTNSLFATLRFSSRDKNLGRAIITYLFEEIDEEMRQENLAGIGNLRRSIESSLNFEIEEIETNIANAIANYETDTASHLAYLTEQAAIARQLGIADNQSGLAARGTNGIGINVNSELPFYLRGFTALEKEIALIKSRGTGESLIPYVPNYPQLSADLRALKTDRRLKRIENGVLLTPLATPGSFSAVSYDLQTITFEPTTSKSLIVIIGTLMSCIIAMIFVLMRHFIAQRKQNAKKG